MRIGLALFWSMVVTLVVAGASAAQGETGGFTNGDRVAFIGDSITHAGDYHAFVYDFYLTRFPTTRVTLLNCGVSGDNAGGANARIEWDILSKHPTSATIMLGMNDVWRDSYETEPPTDAQLKNRKLALELYRANMTKLIGRLTKEKVRLTLITPSPYDQTAKLPEQNLLGVNDALAACGQFAKETAQREGLGLIDFNGPMTALNVEYQKADPTRTLIGPDRVHPGELGHFLMAYYFLKGQQVSPIVASVVIAATGRKVAEAERCTVKLLEASDTGVSYSYLAEALPYPMSAAYRSAESLVPVSRDLNMERICVTGLVEASYEVAIDGKVIGTYSASELAGGINVATVDASPMQQQAQAVHRKNMVRHSNAQTLRTIAMIEAGMHQANVDMADPDAVEKHFAKVHDEIKGKPWEQYISDQIKEYAKLKPREAEINRKVEQLESELYAMNRPVVHTVAIGRK